MKLAKRLKKEKVNCDIINIADEGSNSEKLTEFVEVLNGKDGTASHLVTVPAGTMLTESLVSSPIILGEDGTGSVPGGMPGLFIFIFGCGCMSSYTYNYDRYGVRY